MRELWLEIWRARLMDDCVRTLGNDQSASAVHATFDWFCERLGITEFEDAPSIQEMETYILNCGYFLNEANFDELG